MAKICKILFAIAGAAVVVFISFVIFCGPGEDATVWRAFSVCVPVTGACLISGAVLSVIDFIRKR